MKKHYCEVCLFTPELLHSSFLLHEHHIHPIKLGGNDNDYNKMTVCIGCHHLIHYLIKIGKISINITSGTYRYGNTLSETRKYIESSKRRYRKL